MSDAPPAPIWMRIFGGLLLALGVSVFAIRLQHEGPYALPRGGNGLGGGLALLVGAWLAAGAPAPASRAKALRWAVLGASPVVLYLALYATLAELEEVVVLKATDRAGEPADLRLWIVEHAGDTWVTMPRAKADAHGLDAARVELLRGGEPTCVVATLHDDRATVNAVHHARHAKYAVQRLAASVGLFGRDANETTVALRLDPCPPS